MEVARVNPHTDYPIDPLACQLYAAAFYTPEERLAVAVQMRSSARTRSEIHSRSGVPCEPYGEALAVAGELERDDNGAIASRIRSFAAREYKRASHLADALDGRVRP